MTPDKARDYSRIEVPFTGWKIVRMIGRGSFGAVYEIERDFIGDIQKAAMKVISIPAEQETIEYMYSSGYDDASISRWCTSRLNDIKSEYSLMEKMKGNTNIVSCEDVAVTERKDIGYNVYIRMELLTSLSRVLRERMLDEWEIVKLGKDICRALTLCESLNIIHRDIKPENIMVSAFGDFKLGDFGIARTMEHTTNASISGTERYMAPEIIRGEKYGRDVDTYSLGIVLYWLLNDRTMPFLTRGEIPTAAQNAESQGKRLSGFPLPPPENGSEELKRIVLKACSFDRNDRYSSASEMLADLEKLPETEDDNIPEPVWFDAESAALSDVDADAAEQDSEGTVDMEPIPTVDQTEAMPHEANAGLRSDNTDSLTVATAPTDKTAAMPHVADTLDETMAMPHMDASYDETVAVPKEAVDSDESITRPLHYNAIQPQEQTADDTEAEYLTMAEGSHVVEADIPEGDQYETREEEAEEKNKSAGTGKAGQDKSRSPKWLKPAAAAAALLIIIAVIISITTGKSDDVDSAQISDESASEEVTNTAQSTADTSTDESVESNQSSNESVETNQSSGGSEYYQDRAFIADAGTLRNAIMERLKTEGISCSEKESPRVDKDIKSITVDDFIVEDGEASTISFQSMLYNDYACEDEEVPEEIRYVNRFQKDDYKSKRETMAMVTTCIVDVLEGGINTESAHKEILSEMSQAQISGYASTSVSDNVFIEFSVTTYSEYKQMIIRVY